MKDPIVRQGTTETSVACHREGEGECHWVIQGWWAKSCFCTRLQDLLVRGNHNTTAMLLLRWLNGYVNMWHVVTLQRGTRSSLALGRSHLRESDNLQKTAKETKETRRQEGHERWTQSAHAYGVRVSVEARCNKIVYCQCKRWRGKTLSNDDGLG